jgi:hypothetical protein
VESRLAVVAIDNAGTVELAVVNSSVYGFLDEGLLISTTAEGGVGGADSGSVFYSTSARTSVAFRVVGYVSSTQTTAGAWASAPSNVDNNGANKVSAKITSGTSQASTSGTSIDFTGIPTGVKRVTVVFSGVSTNGSSGFLVQIGSGSFTTSGYVSSGNAVSTGGVDGNNSTSGFYMHQAGASETISGAMTLVNISGNSWVSSHAGKKGTSVSVFGGGDVTLSSVLSRVRVTTVNGTDTFDAGSINILYE